VRGELWTVSAGVYSGQPRPALVIQDDSFMKTDSVTVVPLTTFQTDAPLARMAVAPAATNGLAAPSWLMIDKVTTVHLSQLGQRLGRLTASQIVQAERLLLVFLGMAR